MAAAGDVRGRVRYLHKLGVPWVRSSPGRGRVLRRADRARHGSSPRTARQLLTHIWKTAKGLDHEIPKWANVARRAGRARHQLG